MEPPSRSALRETSLHQSASYQLGISTVRVSSYFLTFLLCTMAWLSIATYTILLYLSARFTGLNINATERNVLLRIIELHPATQLTKGTRMIYQDVYTKRNDNSNFSSSRQTLSSKRYLYSITKVLFTSVCLWSTCRPA